MKNLSISFFAASLILIGCNNKNAEHGPDHGTEAAHQHDADGNHVDAETNATNQEAFASGDSTATEEQHGHSHADDKTHAH